MIRTRLARNETLIMIGLLILISALVYLPLIRQIGYINDDWYLMWSAGAYGPQAFTDIFSVDRPARAWVMIPAYILFGGNPLYYNLSAYVFRLISALALFWLLRMLWRQHNRFAFLASLLYLIYPGFLSQHNGIDYQSQMVSLAAALLSVAFSIRALSAGSALWKFVLIASSILLGWLYLGLVEYFIGFEFMRFACFFLLSSREHSLWRDRWAESIKRWAPNILTPLAFMAWRLFFFQSERGATDVGLQFEGLSLYPLQTIYHWSAQMIQDLFDVMVSAWVLPVSQLTGFIQAWGVVLALMVVGLILFMWNNGYHLDDTSTGFTREAILFGLLVSAAGLFPIAMVNREVAFPSFSRYSLASSVGVAISIIAIVFHIRARVLRGGILAGLFFIAMLTHHANTVKAAEESAVVRNFWWQVAWRVPQFELRTTLVGHYLAGAIEEDYFMWGPASLIYYPEKQATKDIQPGIFAAVLNKDTVTKVLARERQEFDNRKNIITYKNYRNILILSQPTLNSCVHLINGFQPEFSDREIEFILEIGSFSEIEHVLADEMPHTPPIMVFGSEPERSWCYYYEKADLARQRGDWNEVKRLGEEAFRRGLKPEDSIEWMPFLQAYAMNGDADRLTELSPLITTDSSVSRQACRLLRSMKGTSQNVGQAVDSLYCAE